MSYLKPEEKLPDVVKPRVIVIGGGFGGIAAAKALKDALVE
jgi:cation diffusion facilitator CzcD-associated flavoprotein CzcO